ncbi:Chloroperoxidase [Mycena pura]|uniref:Chloroperoxidase n=1 Tax=Mycena pura TaxID=153505 RepID=A0AAD6ULL0_9AGAR|nr:Chloroperoxidase [Mycena pura]
MLLASFPEVIQNICIFSYDFFLTLFNLVAPKRGVGRVTPHGSPGAGGKWPEFIPPKEGDKRSPCPALNALANHGILPRDGRNIKFADLNQHVRDTFNFAPTFPTFTALFVARYLNKDYNKDTCDLAEIGLHNKGIEHDASLLRQDVKFDPDQGAPYLPFIDELLASASGKDADGNPLLTVADLSRYSAKRRAEARATNPDFVLDMQHKMFGSSNNSGLLTIFGGRVADLKLILREERFPDGWESRVRSRMGMTFFTLNRTVFKLERGIKEEDYTKVKSD